MEVMAQDQAGEAGDADLIPVFGGFLVGPREQQQRGVGLALQGYRI